MFTPRQIPGLQDTFNQELMADLAKKRGPEIKDAWTSELNSVRKALTNSGDGIGRSRDNQIDRITDKVGRKLGLALGSGGSDIGARHRQVLLNFLAEMLNQEKDTE
ncbi:MAG: hypothetical protein ACD_28C00189G0004 [uncultured bacterium]|nr:MAG: hypothetical protein ACD_28C00189G0004 [uncultured bacterium]